ncbi:CG14568 [Drosophila busckii]|uniref:CG14568 n=1 Tax=Drosophila busckii TaxID=30019 RepID=A0A0M3QX46_DROBS|nr:CG14568 [Drosophila busckii]
MAFKLNVTVLILAGVAVCALAEPARVRAGSRFQFARQEVAAATPTDGADPVADIVPTPASAPYPPAGVTPSIAFDLPTETEAQPDLTYGPPAEPDNTYGPPAEPDNTYGPPAEPDNTYGPPADPAADQDIAPVDANPASEPFPARLIQQQGLRSRRLGSEKLRSAQIIRSRPVLVYII